MSRSTVIAARDVPVLDGDLVTLQFSAGRGGEDVRATSVVNAQAVFISEVPTNASGQSSGSLCTSQLCCRFRCMSEQHGADL